MASPFDYVTAINEKTQTDFYAIGSESEYVPFVINRALSYFPDTIFYANEMNRNGHIPKHMQFAYLINTITKGKRRSGWTKKDKATYKLLLVKEYYKYSDEKANQALQVLTEDDLATIEKKLYKGGK